jgi:hypothetical protein
MFNLVNNMGVYKVFTVSGEIATAGTATATVVTVPAGWCAVIQSVFLKDGDAITGELITGSTTVLKTAWGNPFVFSGAAVWIGATGDDVKIKTVRTSGTLYYAISGYMVPASGVNRITA